MTDTQDAPAQEPRITVTNSEIESVKANETDNTEHSEETPAEPEQEEQPKPKRDAQSRIRELNARAKAAEERAAALEAQLNGQKEPQKQTTSQDYGLVKPNPADYVGGRFNDDYQDALEAYQEARTEARVQAALEQREATKTVENTVKTIQQKEDNFRESHNDYDDALSSVMDYGIIDDPLVYRGIIEMDNAPEIVYELGKNEDLLIELSSLSPAMRLVKIGALMAGKQTQQQPTIKHSKAPPPVEPIKGGNSAVLSGQAALDNAKNYDEYKAAKRALGML